MEKVHILLSNYCRENACFYIDSRNVRGFRLYKDGLHLLESGKKILANNLIVNLNNFFLETHTHHPPISFWRTFSITTELQILHHERLIHNKNPMIVFKYKQSAK